MMLPLVLVVSVLLQLSTQQEVPGVLLKRSQQAGKRTAFPNTPDETCDGTRLFATCGSCDAVNVCVGNGMDWRYCRQLNPDKPYCNNGECSATPSFNEYCPPSMYCTGSGYYPDPNTCDIYHYCDEQFTMSSVYKCPKNYVFNPETNFCKRKQTESDCMKITCNVDEIFSAYGNSTRYIGYCRYGQGPYPYDMEVYRCPEGTQFNGKICAFQCPGEGRFPDSANVRGYYECYYPNESDDIVPIYQMCPVDRVYDVKLFTCVQVVTTTSPATTRLN